MYFQEVATNLRYRNFDFKIQNFDFDTKKFFYQKTEYATRFPMVENLGPREIIQNKQKFVFSHKLEVCNFRSL